MRTTTRTTKIIEAKGFKIECKYSKGELNHMATFFCCCCFFAQSGPFSWIRSQML